MAKRAPILPEGYNPVGERLKRVIDPQEVITTQQHEEKIIEIRRDVLTGIPVKQTSETFIFQEKEPIPEIPTDKELKDVSARFRCTLSERKKWHEISRELTGDHNQLSHLIRAALLLVENSYEQLKKSSSEVQRIKKPANTDMLGITFYEQKIAQVLFDAIKTTGRPRG